MTWPYLARARPCAEPPERCCHWQRSRIHGRSTSRCSWSTTTRSCARRSPPGCARWEPVWCTRRRRRRGARTRTGQRPVRPRDPRPRPARRQRPGPRHELRSLGWNRLVVLASSDDPYAVRSAFQAGAQAYLLKSASPAVVTDGVKRVLDGGVYADPTVAPLLATGTRVPGTDNTPGSCRRARSRCCSWSPTGSRTRRSARR